MASNGYRMSWSLSELHIDRMVYAWFNSTCALNLQTYQSWTSGHWIFVAKSLGIFSVLRFFGRNFQAPHKQRFGICGTFLFLYATMTFPTILLRHLARAQKWKINLTSHDLKISGKKTSKYKKSSWWPVWSWLDRSHIINVHDIFTFWGERFSLMYFSVRSLPISVLSYKMPT